MRRSPPRSRCSVRAEHLLLAGQALALHGVLIVDRKLGEELPAALQRSIRPRDGTLTFRDELHELHGLTGTRGVSFNSWIITPGLFEHV